MTLFHIGDELPPLDLGEMTRATIDAYAAVSNDPNPMHTDEELAQAAGHPTVFAQGMLGMAYLARQIGAVAGPGRIRRIKTSFRTMTWPGEHITCRARVTAVEQQDGVELVTCDLHTENQDGVPKVMGTATFEA